MNDYSTHITGAHHKARNKLYAEYAKLTEDVGACDFMGYEFTVEFAKDLRELADKIDKYVIEVFEEV